MLEIAFLLIASASLAQRALEMSRICSSTRAAGKQPVASKVPASRSIGAVLCSFWSKSSAEFAMQRRINQHFCMEFGTKDPLGLAAPPACRCPTAPVSPPAAGCLLPGCPEAVLAGLLLSPWMQCLLYRKWLLNRRMHMKWPLNHRKCVEHS